MTLIREVFNVIIMRFKVCNCPSCCHQKQKTNLLLTCSKSTLTWKHQSCPTEKIYTRKLIRLLIAQVISGKKYFKVTIRKNFQCAAIIRFVLWPTFLSDDYLTQRSYQTYVDRVEEFTDTKIIILMGQDRWVIRIITITSPTNVDKTTTTTTTKEKLMSYNIACLIISNNYLLMKRKNVR